MRRESATVFLDDGHILLENLMSFERLEILREHSVRPSGQLRSRGRCRYSGLRTSPSQIRRSGTSRYSVGWTQLSCLRKSGCTGRWQAADCFKCGGFREEHVVYKELKRTGTLIQITTTGGSSKDICITSGWMLHKKPISCDLC